MRINLYSVRDVKMGVFLAPFCSRNAVEASRQITGALADPQIANTPMALTPSDFELCEIASFDDETGSITTNGGFELVCKIDTLVKRGGTVSS